MSVDIPLEVESDFREKYNTYLRTMRQRIFDTNIEFDELEAERKFVNQQTIRTPGRRGEIIKNEEIDKEFLRRFKIHSK